MKAKKMIKTSKFDAAKYLKSPQAMADYLSEALATDDFEFICDALDTIARAKGMTEVAKATGLSRESLYKSLSGTTRPEFETTATGVNRTTGRAALAITTSSPAERSQ